MDDRHRDSGRTTRAPKDKVYLVGVGVSQGGGHLFAKLAFHGKATAGNQAFQSTSESP